MRANSNSVLGQINDIRQVVASAKDYSPKRMTLVFINSEYRLSYIPGINPKYNEDLKDITRDCEKLLDTDPKECFEMYNSRLDELLTKITNDII